MAHITGDANDNTLVGGAGDDLIEGFAGNDLLIGGAGNDTLVGGDDDDVLVGGVGDDDLQGGAGFDSADWSDATSSMTVDLPGSVANGADIGSDTLGGIESVVTGSGDDVIYGNTAGTTLDGGAGNDRILPGEGDDAVDGGDGASDLVDYTLSPASLDVNLGAGTAVGSGNDTLAGIELVMGSAHDDVLVGSAAENTLSGADGHDTLDGRGGDDLLFGNAGFDTVTYANSPGSVSVDLAAGTAVGDGHDSLSSIEHAEGSAHDDFLSGTDTSNALRGLDGDDHIDGFGGADVLEGGNGHDTLDGGAGDDDLDGGAGDDTADWSASGATVTVDLVAGTATGPDIGSDTIDGIERVLTGVGDDVVVGSGAADDIITDAGADTIDAAAGDDYISAGVGDDVIDAGPGDDLVHTSTGNDTIDGGAGDDYLYDGPGDDTVDGGAGEDHLLHGGATGPVSVDLAAGTSTGTSSGNDTLISIEHVVGSPYADGIRGDDGDNDIDGSLGDDAIEGRAGDDILDGSGGTDLLTHASSTAPVHVDLDAGTATGPDIGTDTLSSFENVLGSGHDDVLAGNAAPNVLVGSAGDDTLDGRDGDDTMNGDGGDDSFVSGPGSDSLHGGSGVDTIDHAADPAGVRVFLDAGLVEDGHGDSDAVHDVENVIGSAHDDEITTNASANDVDAGGGHDTVSWTGGGAFSITATPSGFEVHDDAAGTTDTVTNAEILSTGTNSDRYTGGDHDVTVLLGGGDDIAHGGDGDETIDGGSGDDLLCGGDGTNVLVGGPGADLACAVDDVSTAVGGEAVTVDVAGNDEVLSDEGDEADAVAYSIVAVDAGTASIDDTGTLTYTAPDAIGTYEIVYGVARDNTSLTDTAVLSVDVVGMTQDTTGGRETSGTDGPGSTASVTGATGRPGSITGVATSASSRDTSLAATGSDVDLLAGLGLACIAAGVALRRRFAR